MQEVHGSVLDQLFRGRRNASLIQKSPNERLTASRRCAVPHGEKRQPTAELMQNHFGRAQSDFALALACYGFCSTLVALTLPQVLERFTDREKGALRVVLPAEGLSSSVAFALVKLAFRIRRRPWGILRRSTLAVQLWTGGREVGEMTLKRAVRRLASPVSLSPFVSLLALAALLFAVFAIHSEATGHAPHTSSIASSNVAAPSAAMAQSSGIGVAAVMAAPVVAMITSGSLDGMLDCALLAMTCILMLTLVVMVFLTRLPATYRRLLDAGSVVLNSWRNVALPVQRPSLSLLSTYRV
jgi:hypothetical protein